MLTRRYRVTVLTRSKLKLSLQARVQLPQHRLVELGSDRFDLDPSDHFFRKSVSQQFAAQIWIDAACLQVKEFLRIDLAHRCAVRAFHVVGVNLQLRLRVDAGLVRQQEVLVGLQRISLLRAFTNEYLAVENRPSVAVENSFVKLVTVAVRLLVIDY